VADRKPTAREIERDVERERAELRGTVEELMGRFTFDEMWHRAGAYLRDNRGDIGRTVEQAVKEKPLAVALTAVGVAWLLFGPSQQPARASRRVSRNGRADHDRTRRKLEEADFADRSARGPASAHAEADPWTAPSRTPADAPRQAGTPGEPTTGDRDTGMPGSRPTTSAVPGPTSGPVATGAKTIPPTSASAVTQGPNDPVLSLSAAHRTEGPGDVAKGPDVPANKTAGTSN
jgi:hypothetical protein